MDKKVDDLSEWHMVFFDRNWEEMTDLTQTVFGYASVIKIMMQWERCRRDHKSPLAFIEAGHDCLKNVYAIDVAQTFDPREVLS
jgi:hypothetical protein